MTQRKEKTGIRKSVVIATVVAIRDVVKNGLHCSMIFSTIFISMCYRLVKLVSKRFMGEIGVPYIAPLLVQKEVKTCKTFMQIQNEKKKKYKKRFPFLDCLNVFSFIIVALKIIEQVVTTFELHCRHFEGREMGV